MPEVRELCTRVWFDTAALPHLYRPSVIRDAATLVGAERLLLGTDFPLLGLARYRRTLDEAGLDETELGLILGGSAAAVWRWGAARPASAPAGIRGTAGSDQAGHRDPRLPPAA